MEARCQKCQGLMVKTNGPSYKCEKCGKKVYFSLRARLKNGETVELVTLPQGGANGLRSLIKKAPTTTFKTVRSGLITVGDLDPASLP